MKAIDRINDIEMALGLGHIELNEWEAEFIDSIERQINQNKKLTWKQSKILVRIWERIG